MSFILRSSCLRNKAGLTLGIIIKPWAWPQVHVCSVLFFGSVHCWRSPCTSLQGMQWSQCDGYMDWRQISLGSLSQSAALLWQLLAIQEWFIHCLPGSASLFDRAANLVQVCMLYSQSTCSQRQLCRWTGRKLSNAYLLKRCWKKNCASSEALNLPLKAQKESSWVVSWWSCVK